MLKALFKWLAALFRKPSPPIEDMQRENARTLYGDNTR